LVGTNPRVIVAEVERLLTDQDSYARMSIAHNPYGDGRAVERIISVLAQRA
jgi:UDP-N-acetylglucosamine 2-epimerase (non-hydrolysing)